MHLSEEKYPNSLALLTMLTLLAMGCASPSLDIPPENQDRIRTFWNLYRNADPAWPEARAEWISLGPGEEQGLINLLIQEVQRNAVKTVYRPSGLPEPGWKKPVNELVVLGKRTTPSLLEALRILKDETTVFPCQVALKEIANGADIMKAFELAAEDDDVRFQARLVKVLIMLDEPDTLKRVLKLISGPYDWNVRATAVSELSKYDGSMLYEVKVALERALRDEDAFIASTAKKALKALKEQGSKH